MARWDDIEDGVLEAFVEASEKRGHARRASGQAALSARPFDFGELDAASFGLRTSKKAKAAEAREMTRYYMRQWKAAVRADPVKAEKFRQRACKYGREGWVRLKADPARLSKRAAGKRAWYARNRDEILANRKPTPTEQRRQWNAAAKQRLAADVSAQLREKERAHARQARYYKALKADPVRYAKFLERARKQNSGAYAQLRERGLAPASNSRYYEALKADPVRYAKYLARMRDYQRSRRAAA